MHARPQRQALAPTQVTGSDSVDSFDSIEKTVYPLKARGAMRKREGQHSNISLRGMVLNLMFTMITHTCHLP